MKDMRSHNDPLLSLLVLLIAFTLGIALMYMLV